MTFNKGKKSKLRAVAVAAIILLSLLLAFLLDSGVSLIQKKAHPTDYASLITTYSKKYNIPEYTVYAVIKVESDFDPGASSGYADGLMQIAPATFKWLSSDEHFGEELPRNAVFDPETNIKYGCYYLNYLRSKFYDWDTVFAAYNGGEGNVAKWLKDENYSKDGKTLFYIPFKETRNYVKRVNEEMDYYREHICKEG